MSRHKAGLGNASLWFFRQTQALVVRSEGAEVAAGPGHCWRCGGTCWCAGQRPCLPQVSPEELTPSHKAGRHPNCVICLYKWGPGSQGTPAAIRSPLLVEGSPLGSVGCCPHPVLGCLLLRGGSEGFFSFLAHVGTGRAPEGRWEVELGCAGRGLVGSVAPSCSTSAAQGLGDTWGSPGPSVPSLFSIPLPWHGLAPSPVENTLLCQACSPCPQGMARASITGPDGNFSALFLLF